MTLVDHRAEVRPCGCVSTCGCETAPGCALHGELTEQGLEHTRYYPRQVVTPDDLTQDQIYFKDKLRRHNRLLHGWGIVCGLVVTLCAPDDDQQPTCKVKVTSGYAVDPYGNELVLPHDQVLDLCKEELNGSVACVPQSDPWCRPLDPSRPPGPYYLAVRHIQRPRKPVHAPSGCSCREANCENSRIKDDVEFRLLDEKPDHYDEDCRPAEHRCLYVDECPECPRSGWVILAEVQIDGASIAELNAKSGRRHVYSFAPFCLDCGDEPSAQDIAFGHRPVRYVGSAGATPNAVMSVKAVIDKQLAEISIALNSTDITNKTALETKQLFDSVQLFDADDPQRIPFSAGLLLAHSPLTAESKIDGPSDLALRLRTPVIAPDEYTKARAAVDQLLDRAGRDELAQRHLGNLTGLDELTIERIDGIGDQIGNNLRAAGIATLADLRESDESPKPTNADATAIQALAATWKLLRRLHREPKHGNVTRRSPT